MWRLWFIPAIIAMVLGSMILLTCKVEPTTPVFIQAGAFVSDTIIQNPSIADTVFLKTCDTIKVNDSVQCIGFAIPWDSKIGKVEWDFGDGGKSTDSIATHAYVKSGIYKAVFTISGNGAVSDSVMIYVNTPPDSIGSLAPVDGAKNQPLAPKLSWKGHDQDTFDTGLVYTVVISKAPAFVPDTILKWGADTSIVLDGGIEKGDSVSWFVTAQDRCNAQVTSRKVGFTVLPSSNATISSLKLSQGSIAPAFSPMDSVYFDTVQNSVSAISFSVIPGEKHAALSINGVAANPTDSSVTVPLTVGLNSLKITVTAADGTTKKSYTINIFRQPSSIATLSSLKASAGAIIPLFADTVFDYHDTVPFQTDSITITPASSDSSATITVNGVPVKSGNASAFLSLNANQATVLSIIVNAQDGITKKTYTITILKAVQPLIAPADATAVAQGPTSVLIAWKETSTNQKGFVIERSPVDSTGFAVACSTSQASASFLDTNLLSGTRYFYRLFAFNSKGNSGYSNKCSAITKVTLAINANPATSGSVTKTPDTLVFTKGDTVKLAAHPKTGYHFLGWSGGAAGSVSPLALLMDSSRIVTVNFAANCCSLRVTATNGTIARTPDKPCYTLGDTVKITATPLAGYHFAGWFGDTTAAVNPLTIIMNTAKTISASCINRAPVINCPKDTTVAEGVILQFTISASDPDGDPVTLLTGTLPAGATFTSSSGLFNWTPAHAQMGACTLSIVATDGMLSTTQKIVFSVKDLPIISQQPQAQTVCAGQAAKFSMAASGTGPLAYQWQKGTTPIAGATLCSLTIATAAAGDSGVYGCIVSNAAGSVTSSGAVLTINVAPVIASQPVNAAKCPGDSVLFSVQAAGTAPLSYQWRKNGGDIASATSNVFKKTGLALADTGNYSCKIGNACGNVISDNALLSVNVPSTAPTAANATPATICQGGSTVLAVTGGALGTGASWKWYSGGCGGTAVGSGSSINVSPTSTTTFFVRAEGGCATTACASVTVTANALSVAPSSIAATPAVICLGDSSTLSLSGGLLGTNASWDWYAGTCAGGNYIGAGPSIVVKPVSTTIYSMRGRGDCNTTTWSCCTVTVNTQSIAPTSATASPDTVCSGVSTTLAVNGGTLGTGAVWKWYAGTCATGTAAGSGPSISVSPSTTTTYFVRAESACNTTTCASVILIVDSLSQDPTGATANPPSVCSGTPTTLSVTGGKLGYGAQWAWYTNSGCTGSPIATGTSTSISPSSTTTYYVRAEGKCNTTNAASVTVPITAIPAQPTNAAATPSTICAGQSTTLSATNSNTGAVLNWYSDAGCTLPLSSTTQTPAGTTTYYVRAENGSCYSIPASASVTVIAIPAQPTSPAATPPTICVGQSTTLSATNSTTGAILNWYSDAGCTLPLSSTTQTPAVGTTTYFVRAENGTCNSTPASASVTVIAIPDQPTSPAATPPTICQGSSTTLSATNPTAGANLKWYSDPGCTTPLSSTTPTPPTGTTTYYVRAETGTCYSNPASTSVTVIGIPAQPTSPAATPSTICQGSSTTLSATNSTAGATLNWYSDAACTTPLSSTTPTPPVGPTTYYVRAENGTCHSTPASASVTVIGIPDQPTSPAATPSTICAGQSTSLSATNSTAGATLHWYSDAGCTWPLSSTTQTPIGNATYYVRAENGTCFSTPASASVVVIAIPAQPTSPAATPSTICAGQSTVLSATSPTGATLHWYSNAGCTSPLSSTTQTPAVGTTTYYVRAENGTCFSTPASATVTVQSYVAIPQISFTVSMQGGCSPGNESFYLFANISTATPSVDAIYYSFNNTNFFLYTGPISLASCCGSGYCSPYWTGTVYAYAVKAGYCNSAVASASH